MTTRPASSAGRPATSTKNRAPMRPGSSMGRAVVARPDSRAGGMSRPPGTGSRRTSTMTAAGQAGRMATAVRPGSSMRTGTGQINVKDRPVTQQGLTGLRPSTTRGQRQVQDKSYYMGVLRSKIAELTSEIGQLSKQIDHDTRESQNLTVYEKKAETLAEEIKNLQGELADFNTLVDKVNVNSGLTDMEAELDHIQEQNEAESQALDQLFSERRNKEDEVKNIERQLDQQKRHVEEVMNSINEEDKQIYQELQEENQRLTDEYKMKQNDLEQLVSQKSQLEEDLAMSPLKREAVVLHEKLAKEQARKQALVDEINAQGTPEEQRERLLQKVKQDNQEIASMERQIGEVNQKIQEQHEELRELEQEIEEQHGEKNQKYKELKQKEHQMDEFLETFNDVYTQELHRIQQHQTNIVKYLELVGKEYASSIVNNDQNESDQVSEELSPQALIQKLQLEHKKTDEMLEKMTEELNTLNQKSDEVDAEIEKHTDLDALRKEMDEKKKNLEDEKESLQGKLEGSTEQLSELESNVNELKSKLKEDDVHIEIENLEKKLAHYESGNFVLREVIEGRKAETNSGPLKEGVMTLVQEYNQQLNQAMARTGSAFAGGGGY